MDNVRFFFLNRSVVADSYIQGIFFNCVNVFNCNDALEWDGSAETNGETELHIVNSQFTVNKTGFNLKKIGFITGTGNMFIGNNSNPSFTLVFFRLTGCWEYTIVGNNFYSGSSTQNAAFFIENTASNPTNISGYNSIVALNTFDSLYAAFIIDATGVSPNIYLNKYSVSVSNTVINNSSSPVIKEDSVFKYKGNTTFSTSNVVQRVTVPVPSGLFKTTPELATIHWNGDYVIYGNFQESESTATSLVFTVRRYDGSAFTGGPFSYSIRASQ